MRYPNMRYGKTAEFHYYAQSRAINDIARELRRSERTVSDWMLGRQRVPWWAVEVLRLRAIEREAAHQRLQLALTLTQPAPPLERRNRHLRIVA
ncbi:hypothetical protein KTE24_07015 [Burkholderia gladioli]|uniref:hypothetical protein n=1 Tax=Burkholderia gladioli TaxID=28095 RepID=UPI00163F47C8|nr:hypothetical protein [Burkholderia gladioli]MBU9320408.1 hypothetical protein [Burkholderia gladioli]